MKQFIVNESVEVIRTYIIEAETEKAARELVEIGYLDWHDEEYIDRTIVKVTDKQTSETVYRKY